MSTTVTQYALTYKGEHMATMWFDDRAKADLYVQRAAEYGRNPEDYTVLHRAVTYGDWALTTPAPATVAARRARRAMGSAIAAERGL